MTYPQNILHFSFQLKMQSTKPLPHYENFAEDLVTRIPEKIITFA